jgi:hypothetical protein
MADAPSLSGNAEQDGQLVALWIEKAANEAADRTMRRYLQDHCKEHQRRTSELEMIVRGSVNGGDSLRDCMAETQRRVRAVEDAMESWQEDRRWMKRAVTGAVISAVFSVAVTLLMMGADGLI